MYKEGTYYSRHRAECLQKMRTYREQPGRRAEARVYARVWREHHPNYQKPYQEKWCKEHPDYHRKYREVAKLKALTYYGKGRCACVRCGESRMACLSIDHIIAIRGERGREDGTALCLYRWLIKNNFPDGYQTLCMNCQWIKRFENNETRLVKQK